MPNLEPNAFPPGFKFGTGSSAHQTEGAWNEGGKTENIWDRLAHDHPEAITGGANANVACDSYRKYKEDIKMLKHLGVDYYRFSISWTRILPTGFANQINPEGIKHYNDLIDELIAEGIEPVVTIFHYDLPQAIQEAGGFLSEYFADYFADYAKVVFENFGDRVKTWLTINEPWMLAELGYNGYGFAPAAKSSGIGIYHCGQNLLKAHAKTYHLYKEHFRKEQKGRVSIIIHWFGFIPSSNTPNDKALAEQAKQFKFGWFAHPIFSKEGDYPQVMKDAIAKKSAEQGYPRSRLPELGKYWVDLLRGSADFIAINTYTTYVAYPLLDSQRPIPSFTDDFGVKMDNDGLGWPESAAPWLKENAVEFGNMFRWMKKEYGDREIMVTENGWPGDVSEPLDGCERIRYMHRHLTELLKAIHEDKIKIIGYTYWSLMDDYEWKDGYSLRSGQYHVDFNDPNRPRTMKKSGEYYRRVISDRKLPEDVNEEIFGTEAQYASQLNRNQTKSGFPMFKGRVKH